MAFETCFIYVSKRVNKSRPVALRRLVADL